MAVGDVTGDAQGDLVVSAGAGGRVRVLDGPTGAQVRDLTPFAGEAGPVRVATLFLTDDAAAEVVAATGPAAAPRVRTFDGATGQQLVAPAGDFDPAVGPWAGVGVAAGNDPGYGQTLVAFNFAPPLFTPGVPFTITGTVVGSGGVPPTGTVTMYLGLSRGQGYRQIILGAPALTPSGPDESVATLSVPGVGDPDETQWYFGYNYSGDDTYASHGSGPTAAPARALPGDCPRPSDAVGVDPAGDGNPEPMSTPNPVRYVDGVGHVSATDLAAGGFGDGWGLTRSWSSSPGYAYGAANGNGWVDAQQPRLGRINGGGQLILYSNSTMARYFDGQGTPDAAGNYPTYAPRFNDLTTLTYDAVAGEYVAADTAGGRLRFNGFTAAEPTALRGAFVSRTSPAGVFTAVTGRDARGRPAEVQRTVGAGAAAVTESYLRVYETDGTTNGGLLASVQLRRRTGTGAWEPVRSVAYTYYDSTTDPNGTVGDLKRATVSDAAGVVDQSYYRYYNDAAGGTGYRGGLKYVLGLAAYARARAGLGGTDAAVEAATDAALAPYADNYFEYDADRRVTKEVVAGDGCSACSAGQGEYTYSYTFGGHAAGPNSWNTRTVETRPDGSTDTVYTNAYGQVMLSAFTDAATGLTHRTYTRYDDAGRVVLSAAPSAVTGHDDAYPDLVDVQGGNAQYLADGTGLVAAHTYYAATTATETAAGGVAGYQQAADLRQGETGVAVPQAAWTYFRRAAGGGAVAVPAAETMYRNDNGTGAQTTTLGYTWYAGTTQPEQVTVTLPTVSAAQNGPGMATSSTVVYDAFGRPVWAKDAAGFISYAEIDRGTGAVVKQITDVDTTQSSTFAGLPAGWATPAGGGLHLTDASEVDPLGRATKATDAAGDVTFIVYNDPAQEVRVYRGWDAGLNVPTGPTELWRDDRANGYVESLTMSATPAVSGGRPVGTEAVTGVQSLSRSHRNLAGQVVETDAYYSLAGLTYTTSATLGAEGTHFLRTRQAYDKWGQPNRTRTPAGTVTRAERDGLGRVTSEWVGTDDVPATGFWSVTNTAGTDMVKVAEYEYDGGGVGDGNLTQATQFPGLGAAPRVTQAWFDWRDRPVAVKAGVEATEAADVNRPVTFTQYDNLGEVLSTERYDGDGVILTTTAGVPDRPAASLLRAKSTAEYDELGRAFRQAVYSVDPATGAVAADALTMDTWFDQRGQVVKAAAPGGVVEKTRYDGAGRAVTAYTTDGGGDAGWADAFTVTGDAVLDQAEAQYDGAGRVVLSVTRQRFHDEVGPGALGTPTSGVKARVSYAAAYYDRAGRPVASVDVGTNGGAAWTRPAAVPVRSDTVLVSSTVYDPAGRAWTVTDPRGLEGRTEYDLLGRTTRTVENYADGIPSDGDDKTTEYGYGPAGMTSLTAKLTGGGGQTTAWVYGVTAAGGSAIASNDIVGATRWPDPATGAASAAEQDTVAVNALGQPVTSTDRNGTIHALSYDALGRPTADAVTVVGAGVDGAVRRVETGYDGRGAVARVTSFAASVAGAVVNQMKRAYNGLGQLVAEWQAHAGAVDEAATPKVQYTYSGIPAGANHSRPTGVAYPNGRVVTHDYGPSGGLNDRIGRLDSLKDGATVLEAYSYLGHGAVVERRHPEPGVDLSYVKLAGEAVGDAGDQYTGLDRFGRVVDQRHRTTGLGAAVDRYQYGYDRAGNRTYRDNLVLPALGEVYAYDGLGQLTGYQRGTLDAGKTGVAGTPARTQGYDYDAAGNFDAVATDGVAQARTANRQNEVTGVAGSGTPSFDAAGNMTADETGRQFVYDAWNRLVAVKTSGGLFLASYTYDGLGRRVTEVPGAGAGTDLYYSAGWQVLEERVGAVARASYVWSPVYVDALVSRDRDADGNGSLEERVYVLADANYNVTALVSASGAVLERYTYDAFGAVQVRDATGAVKGGGTGYAWVYLHQGGRLSQASGLYSFRMREYSPTLGRWVQVDPILFSGGDGNLYRAVGNGPTGGLDPSGLVEEPGLCESLIPVWGSGRDAVHAFENRRYARGAFYTVMAVTDIFLVKAIVTAGGKAVFKGAVKASSKSLSSW